MSITIKVVNWVDKLKLQNFFVEKDNRVILNLSFNPEKVERLLDKVLPVHGRAYQPNQFELDCLNELEGRPKSQ